MTFFEPNQIIALFSNANWVLFSKCTGLKTLPAILSTVFLGTRTGEGLRARESCTPAPATQRLWLEKAIVSTGNRANVGFLNHSHAQKSKLENIHFTQ